MLPNLTPYYINEISQMINEEAPHQLTTPKTVKKIEEPVASYSPSINQQLVLLQSVERGTLHQCNNDKAFELKEPLQIGLPGSFYGKTCVPYFDRKAVKYLLKKLSANKHVKPDKIVPPIQSLSNCWFNTMFVSFFVSDKGRKFFHFFRQLMIEGKQADGTRIPEHLRNGFALLNYAVEACLVGSDYAYQLDTNAIIRDVYAAIPSSYKRELRYITDVNNAGNPIRYYISLIDYLHNQALQLLFIKDANSTWKDKIISEVAKQTHLPHIIVVEIYDGLNKTAGVSGETANKARSFFLQGSQYLLDSCIIRDISQQHFCCTLTCENKEMAYDGMSFHRLVPLEWKKYINSDFVWEFEGSNDNNGSPLKWSFLHGYQMLIYYRVK